MIVALLVYLLLSNFLISFFFSRFIGIRIICYYMSTTIISSFLISFYLFIDYILLNKHTTITLFNWIHLNYLEVTWTFQLDSLSAVMLLLVTFVSAAAHIYSVEYMSNDKQQAKFLSYLSLFTFFMVILVTSSNLVQLFLGWEGVGICSYLLINFWYSRIQANKSALMAVFINKVGDIFLLFGISFIFIIFKTVDLDILSSLYIFENNQLVNYMNYLKGINLYWNIEESFQIYILSYEIFMKNYLLNSDLISIICLCLIFAAVAKSAQLGLHIWLPEAMEGPTPVSSLIHAATMVTAGIFLILRCSFLFQYTPEMLFWMLCFGSLTALLASTIGLFQNDIKKIVAYSTCSQLGYMFACCGLSGFTISFFHLFNHGFFKALLFLTSGYIIHSLINEQDMRKMGGLIHLLPFGYLMIQTGLLALIGFPFLTGFYSKERILELYYNQFALNITTSYLHLYSYIFVFILTTSIIFSILYSIRLLYFVFLTNYNGRLIKTHIIHYSKLWMTLPLLFLFIPSISIGYLFSDLLVGIGTDYWKNALLSNTFIKIYKEGNYNFLLETNPIIAGYALYWTFYFIFIGIYLFYSNYTIRNNCSYFFLLFGLSQPNIWFYHILHKKIIYFNSFIYEPLMKKELQMALFIPYRLIDKGLLEWVGPFSISRLVNELSIKQKVLTNRWINNNLLLIFCFIIFIVNIYLYI